MRKYKDMKFRNIKTCFLISNDNLKIKNYQIMAEITIEEI